MRSVAMKIKAARRDVNDPMKVMILDNSKDSESHPCSREPRRIIYIIYIILKNRGGKKKKSKQVKNIDTKDSLHSVSRRKE